MNFHRTRETIRNYLMEEEKIDQKKLDQIVSEFLAELKVPLSNLLKKLGGYANNYPNQRPLNMENDDPVLETFSFPSLPDKPDILETESGLHEKSVSESPIQNNDFIAKNPAFDGIEDITSIDLMGRFNNSTLTDNDLINIYNALSKKNLTPENLKSRLAAFKLAEIIPAADNISSDPDFEHITIYRKIPRSPIVLKKAVHIYSPTTRTIIRGITRVHHAPIPDDPKEFMGSEMLWILKELEVSPENFKYYDEKSNFSLKKADDDFKKLLEFNFETFIKSNNSQKPRWYAEFGKLILLLKADNVNNWHLYRNDFLECFKHYFDKFGLTFKNQRTGHRNQVRDCNFIYINENGISDHVSTFVIHPLSYPIDQIIKGLALLWK